ncbi:CAIB/BAIF family enzyme [Coprinopsis cinerea AmutBmut pab1-1]|nr:CAIB/BAIF family enzyme [Coprinopsis cinerea AmutBmut pab1-1]
MPGSAPSSTNSDSVAPGDYSIPSEAKKLLRDGILNNPLHASLPEEVKDAAKVVEYIGSKAPAFHINWRFAESISALKGFQAAMLNVLLKKKYGVDYQRVVINSDHAQLFIFSAMLPVIDPEGANVAPGFTKEYERYFPNTNLHRHYIQSPCMNIYKTKDNRFYHIHGSVNYAIGAGILGLTEKEEFAPWEEGRNAYQAKVAEWNAQDLDVEWNDKNRQAGTICLTKEEYFASEHGKANAHVGLYEIHHFSNPKQLASWWTSPPPSNPDPGPTRPLFGLKVIDLTRMIASPTICRELAEMGASVLRITSPNITDLHNINLDVNWGKWNAHLDLTKEEDRATLRKLIEESHVVVDGYRPGVMQKFGFGKDDVLGFFKDKERGIIYARENCYGWNGPLAHRSGWQQISDAHCGTSYEFGRAMGVDEPVTPIWPNCDYCTGVAGATAVLEALIKQSQVGGSYVLDIALNYYSQWLIKSCGTYPKQVWEEVWNRFGRPVYRHWDSMGVTIPQYITALKNANSPILSPDFFEDRPNKAIGAPVRTIKPILNFPDGLVQLKYNVGSRGNGVDKPKWPEDLLTEVVV